MKSLKTTFAKSAVGAAAVALLSAGVMASPASAWVGTAGEVGQAGESARVRPALAPVVVNCYTSQQKLEIYGAEAIVSATCEGGTFRIYGHVKDTASDGRCATFRAYFDNRWHESNQACPKGNEDSFVFHAPGGTGSQAEVFLTTS